MSMLLHYALEEQMKRLEEQKKAKAENPVEVPKAEPKAEVPVKRAGRRKSSDK